MMANESGQANEAGAPTSRSVSFFVNHDANLETGAPMRKGYMLSGFASNCATRASRRPAAPPSNTR
jgi:hypothetical protein